ncbi:MAG: 16S rRNA (guanine(966)-N(2))-methyltransferase [uncultured Solirubrobacteraceae bacterium]|uniref:16S rRNA (Guanine(966)-N(2))-methyltransferase n=1 Tax=uncultured Solirubrobacteraceae bacterium TaxID=1162706 RepID=A0A6J4T9A3_9ACTN|nr:MAG: 16S rRNA (guanine(966)-N(2))-methyltransferase [uncultured Solirubrobacteraceae bacterium]
MRIIAGAYGGRRLQVPRGTDTRPTSERVREALFSILGDEVSGARVLDLFAGSGALGLEALSRGAASATFVDSAEAAVRSIRANLAALSAAGDVTRAEVAAYLRTASGRGRHYDLVFLDPPYSSAARVGTELSSRLPEVLSPGATVVCESGRRQIVALELPLRDERHYGDTLIRIHDSR